MPCMMQHSIWVIHIEYNSIQLLNIWMDEQHEAQPLL